MKLGRIFSRSLRILLWILLGAVLLLTGAVLLLYSEWGQTRLLNIVLSRLNSTPGTEVKVDGFRLYFPLTLDINGVCMVQGGDTLLRADTLKADVSLLPLLGAKVDINEARLINGFYQMGNADSLMCLKISAGDLLIRPASVDLSNMDISLEDGHLRHACVDMTLRQDSVAKNDTATTQQAMRIMLRHLDVEDLTYKMSLLPTIDSLGANIGSGQIRNVLVDLGKQEVKLNSFITKHLSVAYIAPDSATIAQYPVLPEQADTAVSAPWTIMIDTIRATESQALYTTRGVVPLQGLDFSYIQADSMDLEVTDFFNQATTLRLPLSLHATERCGVTLDATGTFAMDSVGMHFREFNISTESTYLNADGMMGLGDMMTDPALPLALKVNGYAGLPDLRLMFPGYAPYLAMVQGVSSIDANIDVAGTSSFLAVNELLLRLPHTLSLHGHGSLQNVFDPDRLGGDLAFDGHIFNVKSIVKALTTPDMNLAVPPMGLTGAAHIHGGDINGHLAANTLGGRLALDAKLNTDTEGFALDLKTDQFPLHAFLPDMELGDATLAVKAHGKGLDLFNPKTVIDGSVDITSLTYAGYNYHDIKLDADVHDGQSTIKGTIDTPDLVLSLDANGNLTGDTYDWTCTMSSGLADLYALHLSESPMNITGDIEANAQFTPKTNEINASIVVPEVYYKGSDATEFTLTDIDAKIHANDSLIHVGLHNRDLNASLSTPLGISYISARLDSLSLALDAQIRDRQIKVDTLQQLLPPFVMDITAGDDNLINDILKPQQMSLAHLALSASNDSVLALEARMLEFVTGDTRLDSIKVGITQLGDKLHLIGNMDNIPGNMDNWAHLRVDGMLNTDQVSVRINQQNVKHEVGFDLGAIAVLSDSAVTARLMPLTPMIGYKKWTVNLDNFLYYNFKTRHIDANLKMRGADSSLQLYTQHEHHTDSINDITLAINDVHLQDWISFNPFAPPVMGNLSANVDVRWDGGTDINGKGKISLEDFFYDRKKVASLVADLDVSTNLSGTVRAQADLMVDGERTMTIAGNLNDAESESPFNLDFSVMHFPLATVNPFLPADVAQLSGTLNGAMQISGDSEHPIINGEIDFESAAIRMAMTNTSYAFSPVKIPVVDNVVSFKDFNISGTNENPLYINGTVDISSPTSPRIDLGLKARNMMIVNSQRAARGAIIYGKAYLDLDATAKGNLRFMDVDVNLSVLSGTNVNYILTEATNDILAPTNEDMVKFVNLNDTSAVAAADSLAVESMLLMLDAQLNIQSGTTVTVELSANSRDKVQLQPTGYLTYTQAPMSDGRLIGRININNGFVRYTLPVIGSEKMFNFDPNSYVAFNGDILNPELNIHAVDEVKANVTQQGQNSRLVNFDIKVGVTGSLERMDVAFDLSTDDDLTVANELQSMTPEQRANQAMNMLLYNMYTGPGTSASANLTANPLFSFLESQINNWAAQNIKGVDLSFGIDQYNQTTNGSTSSTMSYSYQVSKTLFNDRFKIVVGGNYTTDSNADENLAENLINDISFEYYLNRQQTMLLRLFRHVGYVSILEGEITQTGVGFVYRKKLDRLANMLPKFIRPRYKD